MADTIILKVSGMNCEKCEEKVETALKGIRGIKRAKADHEDGEVWIDRDPVVANIAKIHDAIADAGYEITGQA